MMAGPAPVYDESKANEPAAWAPVAERTRRVIWLDGTSILVILAFALLLCRPVLSGRVPIAADTLGLWSPWSSLAKAPVRNSTLADSALLYLSWESFSKSAISDGEWPMWDPYSFSGFPFAANSQNQVYYPLTWLLWLLPLSGALQVMSIFNICLAGWGMYFYCRVLGTRRVSALLGGLAFCGSGVLQTALELPGVASVYGWLPWMLLTSDLALRLRSWRWTAIAGLCCGLQMVAGHLQWVIYSYFALGCWLLLRVVMSAARSGTFRDKIARVRSLGDSLLRAGLILAAGPALAAVHLAPFFELASRSSRGNIHVSSNSEPLLSMFRMLLPSFLGTPLAVPNYPLLFNNLWYVGVAPLVLAVVGIFARPRVVALFWAAISLLAVLIAFGVGPFLYVRWLPGLQAMLPNRIGFLLVAGLSVLAALGLDAWLSVARQKEPVSMFALGVLALSTCVAIAIPLVGWLSHAEWTHSGFASEYGDAMSEVQRSDLARAAVLAGASLVSMSLILLTARRSSRGWTFYAPPVLLVLAALDLLSAIPDYNSYVSPGALRPGTAGIRWLRQQPVPWRMMPVAKQPVQPSFVPESQLIFGLPSVDGYDSLHDSRYDDFWGLADPAMRSGPGLYNNVFVLPQAYTSPLASLIGVKYLVSSAPLAIPGFPEVYNGEIHIYENPAVLPRAFLVGQAETLPEQAVLERLGAKDFDPRKTVLLEGPEESAPASAESAQGNTSAGDATITSYRRNSVSVDVDAHERSWLVLADTDYPGWHVTVDGREQPLLTADYILRAVRVEPGKHVVTFRFLPSLFVPTLLASVLSLLAVILGIAWPARKRIARLIKKPAE